MASLILFAYLLTLVGSDAAGRTYAAYGGVYIASSLLWQWVIEDARPGEPRRPLGGSATHLHISAESAL